MRGWDPLFGSAHNYGEDVISVVMFSFVRWSRQDVFEDFYLHATCPNSCLF